MMKSEEEKRIEEYNRFMDEWEKRPKNRDLYGNNCYRPDEVALTDEEYELFGQEYKMKTKNKKPLTAHQKAVILMNREASRAVNRVKMLEQLYLETMKAKEVVK